jgi:hypothetical protein
MNTERLCNDWAEAEPIHSKEEKACGRVLT